MWKQLREVMTAQIWTGGGVRESEEQARKLRMKQMADLKQPV